MTLPAYFPAKYPNMTEMARRLNNEPAAIDKELGLSNNASAWLRGRSRPTQAAEAAAGFWLKLQAASESAAEQSNMLLVMVPDGKRASVEKVLRLLECEVVEV